MNRVGPTLVRGQRSTSLGPQIGASPSQNAGPPLSRGSRKARREAQRRRKPARVTPVGPTEHVVFCPFLVLFSRGAPVNDQNAVRFLLLDQA